MTPRSTTERQDWMDELQALQRQPQAPRPDRRDIPASAIAEYAFCGRAWWIRSQEPSAAVAARLAAGTERHRAAGAIIAQGIALERLVTACLLGAAILATITGLLWWGF
jgi:hypothetical protein